MFDKPPPLEDVPISGAPQTVFEAALMAHMRLVLLCGLHTSTLAQRAARRPSRPLKWWRAAVRAAPVRPGRVAAPWG